VGSRHLAEKKPLAEKNQRATPPHHDIMTRHAKKRKVHRLWPSRNRLLRDMLIVLPTMAYRPHGGSQSAHRSACLILQTRQRQRQGSHVPLRVQRRANRVSYQSPETPTLSREAFFVINDVVSLLWSSGRLVVSSSHSFSGTSAQ